MTGSSKNGCGLGSGRIGLALSHPQLAKTTHKPWGVCSTLIHHYIQRTDLGVKSVGCPALIRDKKDGIATYAVVSAEDNGGNVGNSAPVRVLVVDQENPVARCIDKEIELLPNGQFPLDPNDLASSSSDVCACWLKFFPLVILLFGCLLVIMRCVPCVRCSQYGWNF